MSRRAFMPPACCDRCGAPPSLGETLWHEDVWLCATCLGHDSPGRNDTSKTAHQGLLSASSRILAMQCKSAGQMDAAHDYERRSAWRGHAAELIKQASNNRARAAQVALGEVAPREPGFLKDTLTIPDLAALDASVQRTQLLMAHGIDALALALDAANSAAAKDPLEKMHIHQLAVLHKSALEQMSHAHFTTDPHLQAKQFQTANRFIRSFQQGLVALTRLRGGGIPIVQHVHINDGAQAVVGTMQNGTSAKTAPARDNSRESIN